MKVSAQLHGPWGTQHQSPLIRNLGGFESQSGCFGEGNNLLPLPEIETQILGSPANTLKSLYQLYYPSNIYINSSTHKIQARALNRKHF
jgi:hypothetical protein